VSLGGDAVARSVGAETLAYREQLLADVLDHAESEGQEAFLADGFADLLLDDLETDGHWPDYQVGSLSRAGAVVNAWGLDEDRRILFLAIADFERTPASPTIPGSEITKLYNRLIGFHEKAAADKIEVSDHDPVGDLLDIIQAEDERRYERLALFVLTNRIAPDDPPDPDPGRSSLDFATCRVWDLETIRRTRETGERLDPISVDLSDENGGGAPCLSSETHNDVTTFLAFLSGRRLASIYHEYGGRLLERNVRAFLSARGKVNRGIRDTLRNEPERFLAYNNGLTATAASVTIAETPAGPVITTIDDLQIVNGGQTTASLAAALLDNAADLDGVLVQVKLVEVGGDLLDEMVPNISRYANQQNAVQQSDLSSNHDYLRAMQEASRAEWTPASAKGRPTKWYFERARGSYNVDRNKNHAAANIRRFDGEYPKPQRFGKNDLAVFENTWAVLPHFVSRGGQKNFVEFMDRLSDPPQDNAEAWHRQQFRDLAAKAIIFKATDSIVRKSLDSGYKRQVVAYTLAVIFHRSQNLPDLSTIWSTQEIPADLDTAVRSVCGSVKADLIATAGGSNVAEWAKKEACWKTLSEREYEFQPLAEPSKRPRAAIGVTTHSTAHRDSKGFRLADAIEAAQGHRVEGKFRRYRRPKWRHLGDTGIAGEGASSLHAYAAPMTRSSGEDYIFNVLVDVGVSRITPFEDLGLDTQDQLGQWLEVNGFPQ
jgi:hypothetical protein